MKGLGEISPFHRFTNPRRDKSVCFWSVGHGVDIHCLLIRKIKSKSFVVKKKPSVFSENRVDLLDPYTVPCNIRN